MKKLLCIFTTCIVTLVSFHVLANSSNAFLAESKVKFIKFVGTKKTLLGTEYKVYTVRCSDGKKGIISSWNDGKKWCIGETQDECSHEQMTTAEKVCE
jgi:hypothetical protein